MNDVANKPIQYNLLFKNKPPIYTYIKNTLNELRIFIFYVFNLIAL